MLTKGISVGNDLTQALTVSRVWHHLMMNEAGFPNSSDKYQNSMKTDLLILDVYIPKAFEIQV